MWQVASERRPRSRAVSVQQPTNHIFHIAISEMYFVEWAENWMNVVCWLGDTESERVNFTAQRSDNMVNLSESIMYRSANACTMAEKFLHVHSIRHLTAKT